MRSKAGLETTVKTAGLQVGCTTGAWLRHQDEKPAGGLTLSPGDLDQAIVFAIAATSAVGRDTFRGTGFERASAVWPSPGRGQRMDTLPQARNGPDPVPSPDATPLRHAAAIGHPHLGDVARGHAEVERHVGCGLVDLEVLGHPADDVLGPVPEEVVVRQDLLGRL